VSSRMRSASPGRCTITGIPAASADRRRGSGSRLAASRRAPGGPAPGWWSHVQHPLHHSWHAVLPRRRLVFELDTLGPDHELDGAPCVLVTPLSQQLRSRPA
jgi:hypothetical protein